MFKTGMILNTLLSLTDIFIIPMPCSGENLKVKSCFPQLGPCNKVYKCVCCPSFICLFLQNPQPLAQTTLEFTWGRDMNSRESVVKAIVFNQTCISMAGCVTWASLENHSEMGQKNSQVKIKTNIRRLFSLPE